EERKSAVKEFRQILREGGFVFFEAFGCEDMRCGGETSIPFEEKTFARQNGIIYHYLTEDEVRTLFKGFEIIGLEDIIKEKTFRGEAYRRHLIKGVFRKP
ncbi:MAG TPA: class I SAM-dependent methyltransferase, partial [Methanosarcina sp.]|nr:class I SAM-dependent methyltransferase [Methanosarcina sp.]